MYLVENWCGRFLVNYATCIYIICSSNHIHVGAQPCCCYYVQCSLSVYTTLSGTNIHHPFLPSPSLSPSSLSPSLPPTLPPSLLPPYLQVAQFSAEQGHSALTIQKICVLTALLVSLVLPFLTQYTPFPIILLSFPYPSSFPPYPSSSS